MQSRPRGFPFAPKRSLSPQGGLRGYSKLPCRTAPQDAGSNKPVKSAHSQVEPLPAAIREREDQFVTRKIARSWPVAHLGAGGIADGAEAKPGTARVRSREQAIHRLFKRQTRCRSHGVVISRVRGGGSRAAVEGCLSVAGPNVRGCWGVADER